MRIVKIDRQYLDDAFASLRDQLEKKQDDHSTTQHIRGQIATFRKIFKHIDELNAKPEPAPGPPAPVVKEANLY